MSDAVATVLLSEEETKVIRWLRDYPDARNHLAYCAAAAMGLNRRMREMAHRGDETSTDAVYALVRILEGMV